MSSLILFHIGVPEELRFNVISRTRKGALYMTYRGCMCSSFHKVRTECNTKQKHISELRSSGLLHIKCHFSLRNNPEDRSSHLIRGRSPKSRIKTYFFCGIVYSVTKLTQVPGGRYLVSLYCPVYPVRHINVSDWVTSGSIIMDDNRQQLIGSYNRHGTVYCAVRAGSLNLVPVNLIFKVLITNETNSVLLPRTALR